ncbi:MAG TPA: hypothetical protein VN692_11485 [Steroidobacteraceae bacterium]|nr:hypothetical protein [Steroidobacteraceae bacterium]
MLAIFAGAHALAGAGVRTQRSNAALSNVHTPLGAFEMMVFTFRLLSEYCTSVGANEGTPRALASLARTIGRIDGTSAAARYPPASTWRAHASGPA